MISTQLNRFVWKSDSLANCRCFICGDSEKNKIKARGYFYKSKNGVWRYKCHNCSCNISAVGVLKNYFPEHYQTYRLDSIKKSSANKPQNVYINDPQPQIKPIGDVLCGIPSIHQLPITHDAKNYIIKKRFLPNHHHKILFYTDSWGDWISKIQTQHHLAKKYDAKKQPKDARVVIPYYDRKKNIYRVSGRALDSKNEFRYITCDLYENYVSVPYGIERHNKNALGYIVEGPFDSLLLPNAIAAGGSSLPQKRMPGFTFIFDNEPRNREIVSLIETIVSIGNKVVVWEPGTEIKNGKDITDLVSLGNTQKQILSLIHSRTFSGIEAKLELNNWKRV